MSEMADQPMAPVAATGRQERPSRWMSWTVVVASGSGAALGAWANSLPGSSLILIAVAFWCWVLAGFLWLALLVSVTADLRRRRSPRHVASGLLVGAAVVGVTVCLVWLDVPLHIRWSASRSAFESAAAEGPAGAPSDEEKAFEVPDRLGMYRISHAYRSGTAVYIVTLGGGGLLSIEGFARLPDGPTSQDEAQYEGVTFRSVGNGWYAWSASL